MSDEPNMTTHDLERIVLASMIAPETAKAANKAIKAAKFKPEEMFTDADTRREYDILVHHGAGVFDGLKKKHHSDARPCQVLEPEN